MSNFGFQCAAAGIPVRASDGQLVIFLLPAGCVLRRSADLQEWEEVVQASPITHQGADAHYRVDCDTYDGTPITATLEITG